MGISVERGPSRRRQAFGEGERDYASCSSWEKTSLTRQYLTPSLKEKSREELCEEDTEKESKCEPLERGMGEACCG